MIAYWFVTECRAVVQHAGQKAPILCAKVRPGERPADPPPLRCVSSDKGEDNVFEIQNKMTRCILAWKIRSNNDVIHCVQQPK